MDHCVLGIAHLSWKHLCKCYIAEIKSALNNWSWNIYVILQKFVSAILEVIEDICFVHGNTI